MTNGPAIVAMRSRSSTRRCARSSRSSDRRSACTACRPTRAPSSGGERELGELRALLERTRLLTLAGTGGAGKTRLALELARDAERRFPGGAALVELALVEEPERVVEAFGAALDVRALPGRALLDAITDFLAGRAVLLVVDNCEHVLGASAALVDTLLRAAPQLTVVATRGEPLHVPGEIVFRVPSLSVPRPGPRRRAGRPPVLRGGPPFAERAEAAPGSPVDGGRTPRTWPASASGWTGCRSRSSSPRDAPERWGPASIAERLDDRFRLLRRREPRRPTRQRTLARR